MPSNDYLVYPFSKRGELGVCEGLWSHGAIT